jgi:predicted GH43/DUF377 family glycosyl hydrolase
MTRHQITEPEQLPSTAPERATPQLAHRVSAELRPDPARVIARLFLPGEEKIAGRSRIGKLVDRVLALPEAEVGPHLAALVEQFRSRHRQYIELLTEHAGLVRSSLPDGTALSPERELLLGATFTAEYAVEGAALCNPSAVPHPDQSGLLPGQLRVALSVRGIGEGHLSSIGFAEAVIGPGPEWDFQSRQLPAVTVGSGPGRVERDHLRARLLDLGPLDALARNVLGALPAAFGPAQLEAAIGAVPQPLLAVPGSGTTLDTLRRMVSAYYQVEFPGDVSISQQVLMPATAEESHGVEDARFVRFVDDGAAEYRCTYTAYDGQRIQPRMMVSPDLRTFRAEGLAGPAAHNKGMAIFPRKVHGRYISLCRSDGESTGISTSTDGICWETPTTVQVPGGFWALLQVGNCGPPLETEFGWLVLTHGVGPMRVYSVGALLLDLDDPTKVVKVLADPLLQSSSTDQNGYVPNVVYSCGGIIHDGRLWVPHGVGDTRIAVAWVAVTELIDAMIDVPPPAAG